MIGQATLNQALAVTTTGEHDEAVELAVRQHARLVFRVAYSVLRNHHDSEDATQETFIRVMRYRNQLSEVRDLRTWLAKIAWRVANDRRRKPHEIAIDEVSNDSVALRSPASSADEVVLSTELSSLLDRLISGLPAKLRDPLTLSTVEEMSPADISQVLGVNEAVVRSRLFRARQKLREKLDALLGASHGNQ